jgi:hypothetical protein
MPEYSKTKLPVDKSTGKILADIEGLEQGVDYEYQEFNEIPIDKDGKEVFFTEVSLPVRTRRIWIDKFTGEKLGIEPGKMKMGTHVKLLKKGKFPIISREADKDGPYYDAKIPPENWGGGYKLVKV